MGEYIKSENRTTTYKMVDEPVLIHIIKTGFVNRYMIVWEDAFEQVLGDVQFATKEVIESKFNIKLEY